MSEDFSLEAFCQRWNLNEDAQQKLLSLSAEALEVVLKQFHPKGQMADASGKFIMFACSIEKAQANGTLVRTPSANSSTFGVHSQRSLDSGDPIEAFCQHWALSNDARQKLWSLLPEVQQVVMQGFQPAPHLTEVSGKFIMYAVSIERAHAQGSLATGQPSHMSSNLGIQTDPLEDFCQQWGLNHDARQKLMKLRPDVQQVVIHGFQPAPTSQDVSGKFIMYAASIERAQANGTLKGSAAMLGPSSAGGGMLGPTLQDVLSMNSWGPPAGVQRANAFGAMTSAPSGNNGAPTRIMQNVLAAESLISELDPLEAFCQQWSLNDDARNKLYRLTPEAQQTVMEGFKPSPNLADFSGKFIMYAASIEKAQFNGTFVNNTKGGGGATVRDLLSIPSWGSSGSGWAPSASSSAPWAPASQDGAADPIEAFCQHWSLNTDARQKLLRLSPEVQQVALDGFKPPPTVAASGMSGKFIMYASSLEKAYANGTLFANKHAGGPATVQGSMEEEIPLDPYEFFCKQWGLNEDARRMLFQLTPDVQEIVMQGFQPDPNMTEVSGKFIAYANSIQKAPRSGSTFQSAGTPNAHDLGSNVGIIGHDLGQGPAFELEAFCRHWSLNADAQAKLLKLTPEVREVAMQGFQPPPHMSDVSGKFIAYAASIERAQGTSTSSDEQTAFCQLWGLNGLAKAKLLELAPHLQQKAMTNFAPPADSNDANGRFIMFVNGLQRSEAIAGGGASGFASRWQPLPQKRPAEGALDEASLEAFVQQWRLNADAKTKLSKLSPDVQAEVVANFAPRGVTEEKVSGKFIMFAASIEKAYQGWSVWQGGGAAKRSRW